ncbi:hypothetical protein OH492_25095 [Vibrio chagasii]|nr:hypothetical protein [Vibrio chagasii]
MTMREATFTAQTDTAAHTVRSTSAPMACGRTSNNDLDAVQELGDGDTLTKPVTSARMVQSSKRQRAAPQATTSR